MKKALVRKDNGTIALILDSIESAKLMVSTPYQQTYFTIDVPVSLENKPIYELESTLVPAITESWSKYEKADVTIKPIFKKTTWVSADETIFVTVDPKDNTYTRYTTGSFDFTWTNNPAVPEFYKVQENATQVKLNKISSLKNTARSEILAEMLKVFGSSDMNTNQANYSTWEKMVTKSADFASAGLSSQVDIYDSAGTKVILAKGAMLNTATKVKNYANYRVKKAEGYSIWRLQRYEQLQGDILALP